MPPAKRRSLRRLSLGLATMLVAFTTFMAYTLRLSHERYEQAAVTELSNLTLSLERHLSGQFQAADLVLQSAARSFQQRSEEPQWHARDFTQLLAGLSQQLPREPAIRAADAGGNVLYGPGLDSARPLSIAQRRFFIDATTSPGLAIGLPVKSRISQRWVLTLGRPLQDASGRPAGVVYLNLDLEQFASTLDELNVGGHGVITIFNSRREVLLRRPDLPWPADEEPVILSAPQTVAALAAGKSTALFDTHSSVDRVLRTLMYRKLREYPAYVLVGLPRSEMLAPWRREASVAAFVWVALVASVLLLLRTQRRAAWSQVLALAEVGAARTMADEANQAKSAFLANMSHEIRTPMNAIIGLVHLMAVDTREPTQRMRLGKIDVAARHLLQLINDILDLSKVEAGKLALEEVEFALDDVLSQAFDMVRGQAQEKDIELIVDMADLPARLCGDPMRLKQALINLLGNAVKFTERGWVRLRGELLHEDRGRQLVRFEVQDTGKGIAPERLDRLFHAFEQADSTTPRQFGGTGLGLALTRQFATLMGGEVGVASLPDQGSRFWFTARVGKVAQSAPPANNEVTAWGPVLLLGDLPETVEAMRRTLRRVGIEPDVCGVGPAGIEASVAAVHHARHGWLLASSRLGPAACADWLCRLAGAQREGGPPVLLAADFEDSPAWRRACAGIDVILLAKPVTATALRRALESLTDRGPASTPAPLVGLPEDLLRLRHAGQRVLLAEDNAVNQEVGVELLRMVGLKVDVAANGAQALKMAADHRYALILMDVQMPQLDGLAATRALRARDGDAPPIIAMTANAFGDDREACFESGMCDHLSKPVDPAALYACLLRWLPPRLPSEDASVRAPPYAGASRDRTTLQTRLAGLEGFDISKLLGNVGGSLPLLHRAIGSFVQTYRAGVPALAGRGTPGDIASWRLACHTLRGVTATVGATALQQDIARFEAELDDTAATPLLNTHARNLERRIVQLAERLETALEAEH